MTQRAINGDFIYFVTANVQDRRWFFVTLERAETLGLAIQTCCQMKSFELLGYCVLPNHIHLLVRRIPREEKLINAATSQPRLGSLGWDDGLHMQNEKNVDGDLQNLSFLFAHRRRPRRRSLEHDGHYTLSELMHSIKSTYSHSIKQGKFWQHRSYFRIITSEQYLQNVLAYIEHNYRKMNLPDWYGQPPFVCFDQTAIHHVFGL